MTAQPPTMQWYQPHLFDLTDLLPEAGDWRDLPHGRAWVVFRLIVPRHMWEIIYSAPTPVDLPGGPWGATTVNWRSGSLRTLALVQRRYAAWRIEDSDLYRPNLRLLVDMHAEAVRHFGERDPRTRRAQAELAWFVTGYERGWPGHPDAA